MCHCIRGQVSRSRARRASRSANVDLCLAALGREVRGPGAEGVGEAGAADVAGEVVVELDKDKVHGEHGVEGDGGVRADTLGGAGDEVLFRGVGVHDFAERGDEGGVAAWLFVLVV